MISKIMLVGNGPTKKRWGEFIDSFDAVVRFNEFHTDGFEEWVGSKTTIWCFSSNIFHNFCDFDPKCNSAWVFFRGEKKFTSEKLNKRNIDWKSAPLNAPKKCGGFPSTGMHAIYAAMHFYPNSELWISGFRGSTSHYWTKNKRGNGGVHKWDLEQRHIKEIESQGLIKTDDATVKFL